VFLEDVCQPVREYSRLPSHNWQKVRKTKSRGDSARRVEEAGRRDGVLFPSTGLTPHNLARCRGLLAPPTGPAHWPHVLQRALQETGSGSINSHRVMCTPEVEEEDVGEMWVRCEM